MSNWANFDVFFAIDVDEDGDACSSIEKSERGMHHQPGNFSTGCPHRFRNAAHKMDWLFAGFQEHHHLKKSDEGKAIEFCMYCIAPRCKFTWASAEVSSNLDLSLLSATAQSL